MAPCGLAILDVPPRPILQRSADLHTLVARRVTLKHGPTVGKLPECEPGPGLVILGSGSLVAQLGPYGVIDEYQLVVNPTALGAGRTLYNAVKERLNLKLTNSRVFKNGKVYLAYAPAT